MGKMLLSKQFIKNLAKSFLKLDNNGYKSCDYYDGETLVARMKVVKDPSTNEAYLEFEVPGWEPSKNRKGYTDLMVRVTGYEVEDLEDL